MRAAALALLALGLAACQPRDDAAGPADAPSAMDQEEMTHDDMMSGQRSSYADARFLDEMTAHHQMAVDMARAAQTRARSADLRRMAATMLRDQQAEIQEMQRLRPSAAGGAAEAGSMGPDEMARMGMAMPMDSLTAAADFDRAFLEMMIPHHAGAVVMAAEAQARSARPEIRTLARTIIEKQAAEIGEMQRMRPAIAPAGPPADSSAG